MFILFLYNEDIFFHFKKKSDKVDVGNKQHPKYLCSYK